MTRSDALEGTYCPELALGTTLVVLAGGGAQLPVRSPGAQPTGAVEQAERPMATAAIAITRKDFTVKH